MPGGKTQYKATLVYVDPDDWELFQKLCGRYRVSKRLRVMVKEELKKAGAKRG